MKRVEWLVVGLAVGALLVAERLRPLRRRTEPQRERIPRNAAIGALAALTTASGATLVVTPLQRWADRRRIGLLRVAPLPRPVRAIAGFLLLDYTLFLWHWLNHRWPPLWRFHVVHHVDVDLDASTGIRFHFGEIALSVGLRAAQIVLLGIDRDVLAWWSRALFASVLFHHSNVALPAQVDAALAWWIVTPRMHGIHHSVRAEETDSNYSSLLSCWDRWHRLLRVDVPQEGITIGVRGFSDDAPLTFGRAVALPFTSAPPLPSPQGAMS